MACGKTPVLRTAEVKTSRPECEKEYCFTEYEYEPLILSGEQPIGVVIGEAGQCAMFSWERRQGYEELLFESPTCD